MFDFNKKVDRKGTCSTKWDRYEDRYGLDDVIALWVADMDFETVPEVRDALEKRAQHLTYGYTDPDHKLYAEIIDFERRHHHIEIEEDDIVLNTGVVYAVYELVKMLVKEDEKVILMPPIYPPLFNTPLHLNREVVYSKLIDHDETYEIDFEDLEKKIKDDPKIKMFILCNPHNPTGVCYSKEEIDKIAKLCEDNDLWLLSDEIHGDLVMPGHEKYSALRASYNNDKIITLNAPTKTFNLAGMKISYALSKNKEFMKEFRAEAKASGLSSINIFGFEALKAAYHYGDEWLKECIEYIYENLKWLKDYIDTNLTKAKYRIPEATYLAWVDLKEYHLPDDFVDRLMYEGHVQFNPGSGFSKEYKDYIRVNVATDRATLKEGMDRLCAWLKENNYL